MTEESIRFEKQDDGIVILTLHRPEKLNALNEQMLQLLHTQIQTIQNDHSIRGIILTGEGNKAFCAGADIQRLSELNAEQGLQFARQGQAVFRALETLGKPSVAAINGYAFGGGCELAMAATLRIASQNAQFSQPEVKLGVIPGYGGTQRLARLVGKGRALEACLTGRMIAAEEACAWGLVSEVVPSENLLNAAHRWMNLILSQAPLAVRAVMETIDQGFDLSLPQALELEAVHFAVTCASEDKKEGTAAFLDKRKPVFKGR